MASDELKRCSILKECNVTYSDGSKPLGFISDKGLKTLGRKGRAQAHCCTKESSVYYMPVYSAQDFDAMRQRAEKAEQRADELAAMVRATLGQQVKP